MEIIRCDSSNSEFKFLVKKLDKYLTIQDGEEHNFYDQYNSIQSLKYCIVLRKNKTPIAIGAFKKLDSHSVEIKRMYTLPDFRGHGIASIVLKELENWAFEQGYTYCKLETGKRQKEAILLYKRNGYKTISNYGQYKGVTNSKCFEKKLKELTPSPK